MSKVEAFDRFFKGVVQERIVATDELLGEHKDYESLSMEASVYEKALKGVLGDKYTHLLLEYESRKTALNNIHLEIVYEQGLKDGVSLAYKI